MSNKFLYKFLNHFLNEDLTNAILNLVHLHDMATVIQKKWKDRVLLFDHFEREERFHYLGIYTVHVPFLTNQLRQTKDDFPGSYMQKKRIGRLEIEKFITPTRVMFCAVDFVTDNVYVRPDENSYRNNINRNIYVTGEN